MSTRILFGAACGLTLALASTAWSATVPMPAGSSPESLSITPGGDIIVGSSTAPKIYKIKKGSTKAEPWIDLSADGPKGSVLGVLADPGHKTLWACQILDGQPGAGRKTALRGFDLDSGAPKSRWNLPGETNLCNDLAIGPDGFAYVTDTFAGRIWKVGPDGKDGTLVVEGLNLGGADGIAFLGAKLYVNTVFPGNLYRIDIGADGKGKTEEIWMDRLVRNPDGMRAMGGKLLVAENAAGRISTLTITGEKAHVTTVKTGLKTPTAMQAADRQIWIANRAADEVLSVPLPK